MACWVTFSNIFTVFFFSGGDEKEQFDLRPFSVSVELEGCVL